MLVFYFLVRWIESIFEEREIFSIKISLLQRVFKAHANVVITTKKWMVFLSHCVLFQSNKR